MDSIQYADPESVNGLNLYAYCNNNPILYVDPTGHAWWHWLVAAAVVVALAVATVVTAGGVVLGATAISAATIGTTAVGASAVTTTLAYATVGAGVALAASGIYAGITATENGVKSGSASNAFNTFSEYGETALYSTIAGGLTGGVGGYFSYVQYGIKTPGKSNPLGVYYNTKYNTIAHYGISGKMSWSKHLTDHGNPHTHSAPHWHLEMPHTKAFNTKGEFVLSLIKRILGGN